MQQCLDAAYRYLSYRLRSEGELRQRLQQRGYDRETVERAIGRLREQNLSDDLAFATFWKESRLSSKPRSKRLIQRELSEKKVPPEIREQVTSDIDDEANACRLGRSRMHTLARLDYPNFHRRLRNYLGYRGFSYEVIRHTIALLWRERESHVVRQ